MVAMGTQGCNSIDIWNLRLELGRKLRQGVRTLIGRRRMGRWLRRKLRPSKMSIELHPRRCKKVLAAWAIGAGPFYYPEVIISDKNRKWAIFLRFIFSDGAYLLKFVQLISKALNKSDSITFFILTSRNSLLQESYSSMHNFIRLQVGR